MVLTGTAIRESARTRVSGLEPGTIGLEKQRFGTPHVGSISAEPTFGTFNVQPQAVYLNRMFSVTGAVIPLFIQILLRRTK